MKLNFFYTARISYELYEENANLLPGKRMKNLNKG